MNNNTASRAKEMRIVESFVDCNDILGDHVNLQSRATENGYLYFPGLLPAEEVFQFAAKYYKLQNIMDYSGKISI